MDWQIIDVDGGIAAGGWERIVIDGLSYWFRGADGRPATRRDGSRPGVALPGRDLDAIRRGEYGPVAQAWEAAHREYGMEPYFGYRGIMNELGDMASVFPNWQGRPA